MATEINFKVLNDVSNANVHFMPCSIEHAGEAKVSQYFEPSMKHVADVNTKNEVIQASFRGRPLQGTVKDVHEGYVGLILGKDSSSSYEKCVFKPVGKFQQYTYWNLDQAPSGNDKLEQALKWIDISNAIHSSVSESSSQVNSQASSAPSIMLDEEENDEIAELPNVMNMMDVNRMLLDQKRNDPSQFVSHWEMDEQDVNEATAEEIQNNPAKRILWAAENGKKEVILELLNKSSDLVNVRDDDGYTPLHRASYEGHAQIVQLLLDKGADVGARTEDNWTPLHSASNWGQAECALVLLRHGADINAQTSGLHTPLHLAATNCRTVEIFKVLLTNSLLDLTVVNQLGETARDVAVRKCPFHHMFPDVHSIVLL